MTVLMEWRELPVVALGISNRFGAAFEESKIKGIAHVIEHLLFTGTKTRTHEDISREIEKKGGVVNAFTANEITSYYFKLPSEHVFAGLDILHDILENPIFEPKKFEKEKKVILEEIKMYHDSPQHHVGTMILSALFKGPFGEGIIGSENTVSALQRDFVYNYFRAHYSPENYIVTIVGNADFEKICAYLEEGFTKRDIVLKEERIGKTNEDLREARAGIDQAHYIFAAHAPLPGSAGFPVLEVLDAYLANGMSSRLFLKIREEKGLAYAVKSSINGEKNYCYYDIYVGTMSAALSDVQTTILEEFKAMESMTDKDLKEAQERLIGLRKLSAEESTTVMNELLFAELAGKAEDYYGHEASIRAVALADVKKLAKTLMKDFSTAVIVPK